MLNWHSGNDIARLYIRSLIVLIFLRLQSAVVSIFADHPITVSPLTVKINCAFDNDYTDLEPAKLQEVLSSILPFYSPSINGVEALDLRFEIKYHISYDRFFFDFYKQYLSNSTESYRGIKTEEISSLLSEFFTGAGGIFELPIVIFHSNDVLNHSIYASSTKPEYCTQAIIGAVVFLDLSATYCDNSDAVSVHHNRLANSIGKVTAANMKNVIVRAVASAVDNLVSSDIAGRQTFQSSRIFCPVVILTNSENSSGAAVKPNITLISSWLQSLLLPQQEVLVMSTLHYIDEYPTIVSAIARATRRKQVRENELPFLDATVFLESLESVGDSLWRQLVSHMGYDDEVSLLMTVQSDMAQRGEVRSKSAASILDHVLLDWLKPASVALGKDGAHPPGSTSKVSKKQEEKHYTRRADLLNGEGEGDNVGWMGASRIKRGFSVIPVFVLSDVTIPGTSVRTAQEVPPTLDQHADCRDWATRSPSECDTNPTYMNHACATSCRAVADKQKIASQRLPFLPILSSYALTEVVPRFESVVAMHSSFSASDLHPSSLTQGAVGNISDLDANIAAGLSEMLVGFSLSHRQPNRAAGLIDLTWTHGIHPFAPFGTFSSECLATLPPIPSELRRLKPERHDYITGDVVEGSDLSIPSYSSVLSACSRRSALFSRIYKVHRAIETLSRRSLILIREVVDSLLILYGTASASARNGSWANSETRADYMKALGPRLAAVLSVDMKIYLDEIEGSVFELRDLMKHLNAAIHTSDFESALSRLDDIEDSIERFLLRLGVCEEKVKTELDKCTVTFDLSVSRSQDMSLTTAARLTDHSSSKEYVWVFSSWRSLRGSWMGLVIFIPVACLFIGVVAFIIKRFQEVVEENAKKLR